MPQTLSSQEVKVLEDIEPLDQLASAGSAATVPHKRHASANVWTKLSHLQSLKSNKLITEAEFDQRKRQLVDELTGTKIKSKRPMGGDQQRRFGTEKISRKRQLTPTFSADRTSINTEHSLSKKEKEQLQNRGSSRPAHEPVIARPPPSFASIGSEPALLYVWDMGSNTWATKEVLVKIEDTPFARGSLRMAYHMTGLEAFATQSSVSRSKSKLSSSSSSSETAKEVTYVAKISIDPFEEKEAYLQDVKMQILCKHYAAKYNTYNPPKHIDFIKAWLLELLDRPGRPLAGVERFIEGPYRKHNNNFGYVSEEERNTPQAFSHFTYEVSNKQLLICDIQGVGDCYTDPQCHSVDGLGYGKGNMGVRGFTKFLSTHRCNAICRYLKLPLINAKELQDDIGTIPNQQFMSYTKIKVTKVVHAAIASDDLSQQHASFVGLPALKKKKHQQKGKSRLFGARSPLLDSSDLGAEMGDQCCKCTIL